MSHLWQNINKKYFSAEGHGQQAHDEEHEGPQPLIMQVNLPQKYQFNQVALVAMECYNTLS